MKGKSYFFLFSGAIFLFILIIEKINGRFWLNDFKVYYSASEAFLAGDQVYGIAFGLDSGVYKYAPVLLFLFAPYTLLPFEAASVIHYLITAVCTCGALNLAHRLSTRYWKTDIHRSWLLLSLSFLAILNHLFRELHLGNVNMILVYILLNSQWLLLRNKNLPAGVLFALACLFKPYFILLTLPLLMNKKWKMIAISAGAAVALIVLMTLITGVTKSLDLHREWLASMSSHSVLLRSNHTLHALIKYYLNIDLPAAVQYIPFLMVAAAYCFIILWRRMIDIREKINNEAQLIFSLFLLLAAIPNLLITDTEHFLFSLPLIVWCMQRLFTYANKRLAIIFAIILFFFGTNPSDIYGSTISTAAENAGLLGLSNIALILFSTYLLVDYRKNTSGVPAVQLLKNS